MRKNFLLGLILMMTLSGTAFAARWTNTSGDIQFFGQVGQTYGIFNESSLSNPVISFGSNVDFFGFPFFAATISITDNTWDVAASGANLVASTNSAIPGTSLNGTLDQGMFYFAWYSIVEGSWFKEVLAEELAPNTYLLAFDEDELGVDSVYAAAVDVAPVPIPAGVWLFGSVLLGIAGLSSRKSTTN